MFGNWAFAGENHFSEVYRWIMPEEVRDIFLDSICEKAGEGPLPRVNAMEFESEVVKDIEFSKTLR